MSFYSYVVGTSRLSQYGDADSDAVLGRCVAGTMLWRGQLLIICPIAIAEFVFVFRRVAPFRNEND